MIVIAIVVVLMLAAWWMDRRARRAGSRVRSAGDMLSRRHERNANVRATPQAMLEGSQWDRSKGDQLKDKNRGGI
jgi:Flp pilus assembly protein TadB